MSKFFQGFEKAAEAKSLIGSMPNLAPGNKAFSAQGSIKPPNPPNPGIVRAPKSDLPPLGTMAKHDEKHNLQPVLPQAQAPKINVPKPRRKGL